MNAHHWAKEIGPWGRPWQIGALRTVMGVWFYCGQCGRRRLRFYEMTRDEDVGGRYGT